ncbi:hypothetical protein MHIP_56330 [Mycolicibacterium hippocampi]|uniref:Uncharacterized protein n=1 Tax=Mycolicibacterium hippocampi TaxID=659824 RepID=A0A7I9ZVS8_9MYCO|nr:hypothetical protein MHIP_56330 [Mycolicibacterium hippocampi]
MAAPVNVNTPPDTLADTSVGSEPQPNESPTPASLRVTVAEFNSSESRSVITTTGLIVIAEPVVPAATGVATTTGASEAPGTPTTVTTLIAGTSDSLPSPSTTAKVTVLIPASAEVNVTDSNNA